MNNIQEQLKQKIAEDAGEIDALKKELAALNCNIWAAIFTLGIACNGIGKKRSDLRKVIAKH